jgi:hypothetical protein
MYIINNNPKYFDITDRSHAEKKDKTAERFGNKDRRGNNGLVNETTDNLAPEEVTMYDIFKI